jgi:hypothetical protein
MLWQSKSTLGVFCLDVTAARLGRESVHSAWIREAPHRGEVPAPRALGGIPVPSWSEAAAVIIRHFQIFELLSFGNAHRVVGCLS